MEGGKASDPPPNPTSATIQVLAEKMTSVESPPEGAEGSTEGAAEAGEAGDAEVDPVALCRRGSDMIDAKWKRVATLEFNRNRKSMSVLVKRRVGDKASATAKKNAEARLYVKGAPEVRGTGRDTRSRVRARAPDVARQLSTSL